ncbi:CHAP domain-containing protein, partial [Streptomyces sp. NPDC003077]|uniref:CHAP domain-containing protein n=1 Tax=Streptomyces sp. NPDC003077 TaxID=3154443 RepID=UPI0033B6726E
MANTASSMIAECAKHIGYKEGPNNDNKFGVWYPMNHQPWCAMFISYCAAYSGNDDIIPKYAACVNGVAWFRERGLYDSTPSVGAIVFYGPGGGDHTEIVESFDETTITTIGGNTNNDGSSNGDGVYRRHVKRNSTRIHGYGHPNYKQEEDLDMPKRVSLGRNAEAVFKPNERKELVFDVEYDDAGNQHGAGG